MDFVCPKCFCKLNILESGTAVCQNGHCYDRSRFGYYNLLLENGGGVHGDNREMVDARRDFLGTGAYLPLAEAVGETVSDFAFDGMHIVDIGCGEGYYTDIAEKKIRERVNNFTFSAVDISKDAAKRTAKRNKNISSAVASAYKLPLMDVHTDIALSMFAPLATGEILRILRPGGKFILVIPGEEHLLDLKEKIYKDAYRNTVSDTDIRGFTLLSQKRIFYSISLTKKEDIKNLFMMTPYAYRTDAEGREKLEKLEKLTTRAEFILFVYEKNFDK